MAGLFSTPDEVLAAQNAQQDQQALNYAQLAPAGFGSGGYLGMRGGQMIGGALSGPSPAVMRSVIQNQALQDASDMEPGSDAHFLKIASNLQKAGLFGDSISVLKYAADQGNVKAKTELEKAQAKEASAKAAQSMAILGIVNGPGAGAVPEDQPSPTGLTVPPGTPGTEGAPGSTLTNEQRAAKYRDLSMFPGLAHLGTQAEHYEKKADEDRQMEVWKKPDTGIFTIFYNDPTVGGLAKKAQESLTNGNMAYPQVEKTWGLLASKATPQMRVALTNMPPPGSQRTADAITDLTYQTIQNGGVIPPRAVAAGAAGEPVRAAIQNNVARVTREIGITPQELSMTALTNKPKIAALGNVEKDLAAIRPYDVMLDTNANIAVDLAKKIQRTDSKLANKPITWLKANMSDDPDVSEYLFQMNTVSTEGARVLNNPRLVGQLTDSARDDMKAVVDQTMPLNATVRVLGRMQSDGKNRVVALENEKTDRINELRQFVGAPPLPRKQMPSTTSGNSGGSQGLVYKGYRFPDQKSLDAYRAASGG